MPINHSNSREGSVGRGTALRLAVQMFFFGSITTTLIFCVGLMNMNNNIDTMRGKPFSNEPMSSSYSAPFIPPPPSQSLPKCDVIMSQPFSPYATGDFITRPSTPYQWTPRADGSREFDLTSICSLKRYTAEDARQCLADKHLVFIGDSVIRYQFLSLAHFLEKGQYPARFTYKERPELCQHIDEHNQTTCDTSPSVCFEGDWGNWDRYLRGLGGGAGVEGSVFQGRMDCPCVRHDAPNSPILNNMHYVTKHNHIKLTHFLEIGWGEEYSPTEGSENAVGIQPLKGFFFTNCSLDGTCTLDEEQQNKLGTLALAGTYDYRQHFPEAISAETGVIRKMFPTVDYAFYNRGLWGTLTKTRSEEIFPLLREWTAAGSGRCFYQSTPGTGRDVDVHAYERGTIRPPAILSGCSFVDFGHMTFDFTSFPYSHPAAPDMEGGRLNEHFERSTIFWDSVHFIPWVYEEMNNVLLNVICNWKQHPQS